MSTFTECIACLNNPNSWEEVFAFLIVEDTDGSRYLNINLGTRSGCDNYSPAVNCISPQTLKEMVVSAIVEDECGLCSLNVLSNCCE